jgi:hypothetical protein
MNHKNKNGTIKIGTYIIVIHCENISREEDEVTSKDIGKRGKLIDIFMEYGSCLYTIDIDGIEKFCFSDDIEVDKSYYRDEKIERILNKK